MPTSTKTRKIRPGVDDSRRADLETQLGQKYHVKWSFLQGVPTSAFDVDKSLHNQARFDALDGPTVALYESALKRGDVFPAVLAWRPGANKKLVVIDGNHRLAAHEREGLALDVYEIDPTTDPRTVTLMTYAFNTRHGNRSSQAERVAQGVWLVGTGASYDAAATAVNLDVRVLKKAITKHKADARADEVGLRRNEWDGLAQTVRNRLLTISTDEGFRDAAQLAVQAHLDSEETQALVVMLNESGKSGVKHRAIVAAQRDVLQDRIQAGAGGVLTSADRRKLSPKGRIALALSQSLSLPESDDVIIGAYSQAERPDAAKKMRQASERYGHLADLLES